MKTKITILTTLLALSALSASASIDADLRYAIDFNGDYNNGADIRNDATNAGTTEITSVGTAYRNYETQSKLQGYGADSVDGGNGFAYTMTGGEWEIDSDAGLDGISSDRGFTLSFSSLVLPATGTGDDSAQWRSPIGFTYGGTQFDFEYSGAGALILFYTNTPAEGAVKSGSVTSVDPQADAASLAGLNNLWYNYSFSVFEDRYTFSVYDKSGLLSTTSGTFAADVFDGTPEYTLTNISAGAVSQKAGRTSNKIIVDDVALYDGAILVDQAALIAQASFDPAIGFAQYIPEPSTATMSLLALAGLLARRRRRA